MGTLAWIDTGNIFVNDLSYASVTATGTGDFTSHYLKATNFGFTLPVGSIVAGIVARIERYATKNDTSFVRDSEVKIIKSDSSLGLTNKADTVTKWGTAVEEQYISYGGYYDLWNESWTASDINSSNFGVALAVDLHLAGICLAPDTLIATPEGPKQISAIKVGDLVYSFNLITGVKEIKPVTEIFSRSISHYDNTYYSIETATGTVVNATWNHDFFVDGIWKNAKDLLVGDILTNENGQNEVITDITLLVNNIDEVWDITVEGDHNFYANGLFVHNASNDAFVNHVSLTVYYYGNSSSNSPSNSPSVSPSPSAGPAEKAILSIKIGDDLSTSINHRMLAYRDSTNFFTGINRFGTTSNYLQIDTNGVVTLSPGSVVLKKQYVDGSTLRNGTSAPTFTTFKDGVNANSFVDGATNEAHGSFEIQSDYKDATDLTAYLHWAPSTTNVGNCRWVFEYTVANPTSGTFGTTSSMTVDAASGGTAFSHNLVTLGSISGTGLTKGAIIMFRILRQGTSISDTFTGDSFLLRLDLEYQADKL